MECKHGVELYVESKEERMWEEVTIMEKDEVSLSCWNVRGGSAGMSQQWGLSPRGRLTVCRALLWGITRVSHC